MGSKLRRQAEAVLETAPRKAPPAGLPDNGWMGLPDRAALLLLAGWAQDRTFVTWRGVKALQAHMGCSVNVPGKAIRRLVELGFLTMIERPGRAAIYLVHPAPADQKPVHAEMVKAHLRAGKFGAADQTLVLDRMAEAGLLAAGGAEARTLTRGVTPTAGRGSARAPDPHTSRGIPSHLVCQTLTRGVTETEENLKRETAAAPRPAQLSERAGTAEPAEVWTKAEIDRMHREAAERLAAERNGSIAA